MSKTVIYNVAVPEWNMPETRRTTLPKKSIWSGECIQANQIRTGVFLTGVWHQTKADRYIGSVYSIWNDGKGYCKGEYFVELTKEEVEKYI